MSQADFPMDTLRVQPRYAAGTGAHFSIRSDSKTTSSYGTYNDDDEKEEVYNSDADFHRNT